MRYQVCVRTSCMSSAPEMCEYSGPRDETGDGTRRAGGGSCLCTLKIRHSIARTSSLVDSYRSARSCGRARLQCSGRCLPSRRPRDAQARVSRYVFVYPQRCSRVRARSHGVPQFTDVARTLRARTKPARCILLVWHSRRGSFRFRHARPSPAVAGVPDWPRRPPGRRRIAARVHAQRLDRDPLHTCTMARQA